MPIILITNTQSLPEWGKAVLGILLLSYAAIMFAGAIVLIRKSRK